MSTRRKESQTKETQKTETRVLAEHGWDDMTGPRREKSFEALHPPPRHESAQERKASLNHRWVAIRYFFCLRLCGVERVFSLGRPGFERPVPCQSLCLVSWAWQALRPGLICSARDPQSFPLALGDEGQWKGLSLTEDLIRMRNNRWITTSAHDPNRKSPTRSCNEAKK